MKWLLKIFGNEFWKLLKTNHLSIKNIGTIFSVKFNAINFNSQELSSNVPIDSLQVILYAGNLWE